MEPKRNYSLLKTIPLSFFSKDLYRDVYNWPGLGFGYVCFLLFLISIPYTLIFTFLMHGVKPQVQQVIATISHQVPQVVLKKDGEISLNVAQPYYIWLEPNKTPKDEPLAIIDTTRPIYDWNKTNFRGMVFGKTQMLNRSKESETRIYTYPQNFELTITSDSFQQFCEKFLILLWLVPLFLVPFFLLFVFIYRIAQLFLYGGAGKLISYATKTKTTYSQCVRLASVAITPATLLGAIGWVKMPWLSSATTSIVITLAYLTFALWANTSRNSHRAVDERQ